MSARSYKEKAGDNIPFRAYMIHIMNPLRVNANGITKNNRISADVDSNSSFTIPMA